MADVLLLDGERLLHTSKANAVIVPSDYGLSRFAADDLLPLVGLAGREAIGGHLSVTSLRLVFVAHRFNRLKGSTSIPLTTIEDARTWNLAWQSVLRSSPDWRRSTTSVGRGPGCSGQSPMPAVR